MVDTDVGRVPAEPGSCPSGQAPAGLAASPVDPSREKIPWLHIRGQFSWHGEALISGTISGLLALRDALTQAIENRDGEADAVASDGEEYTVTVRRCARIRDMGSPPYIDELARAGATFEREWLRKQERYNRDIWKDRGEKLRSDSDTRQTAETGMGSVRSSGSGGPQDIANPATAYPPPHHHVGQHR